MSWTDERVELLKKLWADGLSASQIANQLGGVSRNAVIGKVHRLKLSSRGRASQKPARPKKPSAPRQPSVRSAAPRASMSTVIASQSMPRTSSAGATALKADYAIDEVAEPVYQPAAEVVVPMSRRLSLLELSERTCKWPIGDPLHDDFHFCGNDSGEGTPYCKGHAQIAYQQNTDRKRSR
ncbi:GcrA family cell cycle regulator [Notoacmeibacter sp. MSK16QG-6]|uniref:GcrA family cell cycle regulator n=1 Tax=Notoacmeibacter sp. MSK16QG-6 TaxID=2957982 RepID=UPI00209D7262|nr:GcrA family cell cycle regulator [Notoacmeibacter sp. MSK16QG-6]MCP1198614.1 GcrA family cell cycle regulator [Notoacmeibacter sp. MSK16QG-6]